MIGLRMLRPFIYQKTGAQSKSRNILKGSVFVFHLTELWWSHDPVYMKQTSLSTSFPRTTCSDIRCFENVLAMVVYEGARVWAHFPQRPVQLYFERVESYCCIHF